MAADQVVMVRRPALIKNAISPVVQVLRGEPQFHGKVQRRAGQRDGLPNQPRMLLALRGLDGQIGECLLGC